MGQANFDFQPQRKIYSVSELNQAIRDWLEPRFLDVWVTGEISNLRAAGSGHYYFTLKDNLGQIRAVCFRSQARYLKFKPEDGLSVVARGRLSVYQARGEYQIQVEYLEPAGLGSLQLAFEQLKAKLAAEGLFDVSRKRPLPVLPRQIGVVTSPSGAVIRDILRVLRRRFPNISVLLYPVRVQGDEAAREIVQGIEHFNRRRPVDVMIVARGGGSLEDLWAFNQEEVARAIAASAIPVISGVGHETDFTIADFVADLRAPTPSAAAELVVRPKEDFEAEIDNRARRLTQVIRLKLSESRRRLTELRLHRVFESMARRLGAGAQRVDDCVVALEAMARRCLSDSRHRWIEISAGIYRYDFRQVLGRKRAQLGESTGKLDACFRHSLVARRNTLTQWQSILHERSPIVILNRGYSITRDASGRIVRDAASVPAGSEIFVRLARGELDATVKGTRRNGNRAKDE